MRFPERLLALANEEIDWKKCEGFVHGEGPEDAKIVLVGESPGADEVAAGRPFVGQAGKNLDEFLAFLGFKRESLYITSTTHFRPFKVKERVLKNGRVVLSKSNRPPTKEEIKAHAVLLDYELERIAPQLIVTLGNVPLKRLLGEQRKISEVHGCLLESKILRFNLERKEYEWSTSTHALFPLYHPASVIYRRGLKEIIFRDLETLKTILSRFTD
ncbi:uracil-DNA glycosylase [Bacillaceae bacterium]